MPLWSGYGRSPHGAAVKMDGGRRVNATDFDADPNTPAVPLEDPAATGGTTAVLKRGSRSATHRSAPAPDDATETATDSPTWDPLPLYTPSEAARLLTVPHRRQRTSRVSESDTDIQGR
jgi:hypothetical protein